MTNKTCNVKYKLAVYSGYKANIVKMGRNSYDEGAYAHKDNFPDIEITRPGIDTNLELLHTKCLVTVNGFIYPTVYQGSKVYVPDVTGTMIKSRSNHLGLLSFNSLCVKLKKTKVTLEMLSSEGDYDYFNKLLITFPEEVEQGFLVLAGYMIFEQPEFFYRVSGNTFVLRLDRLNYIEKIYELSKYRDIYKELGLETSVNNKDAFRAEDALSNETIGKLLTLNNTFLVETPGYDIETNKIYLEHSNVPGNFRTEMEPTLPLFGGQGKVIEYIKRAANSTKFNVYTTDAYMNNYIFSKMSTSCISMYNSNREVGRTYELSRAFFIDIKLTRVCVPAVEEIEVPDITTGDPNVTDPGQEGTVP